MILGQAAEAAASLNDALTLGRDVGDGWLVAEILTNMGEGARIAGQYERAATYYEEALALFEQTDDRCDSARVLCCLAFTACRFGAFEQAMSYDRSSALHEEFGSSAFASVCSGTLAFCLRAPRTIIARSPCVTQPCCSQPPTETARGKAPSIGG